MNKKFVAAYVLGAVISWPVIVGMLFHDLQGLATDDKQWRDKSFRQHLGISVMVGTLFSAMWPVGLPIAACSTGFAEHGIWTLK
jgi:hypothetical protein